MQTARDDGETVRLWLAERTYSDDEQNLIILVYATLDGERYLRKERALTSFSDVRDTTASIEAAPEKLGDVSDPETREQYANAAQSTRDEYAPDDLIGGRPRVGLRVSSRVVSERWWWCVGRRTR